MSWIQRLNHLFSDPAPDFVFEISPAGIAWAEPRQPAKVSFQPLDAGVLRVNPLHDNILHPEEFTRTVGRLLPPNGGRKQRRAALILPDFCARITVLDFDTLPADPHEQEALIRFRIKKTLPFDVDTAVVSFTAQSRSGNGKKYDVVVAAIAMEVAARYEAPFRQAGCHPGFVTVSALAALSLQDEGSAKETPVLFAKRTDSVLSLSVLHQGSLRFFRCLELESGDSQEILDIFFPTFAYIQDELATQPQLIRVCGFPPVSASPRQNWEEALDVRLAAVRSRFGSIGPYNAGLYGYLETAEGA